MEQQMRRTVRKPRKKATPPGDGYITLAAASAALGGLASYRMVDHWDGLGVIDTTQTTWAGKPADDGGSGTVRWLSPDAFADLEVVAQLVDYGWDVGALVEVSPEVRQRLLACVRGVLDGVSDGAV